MQPGRISNLDEATQSLVENILASEAFVQYQRAQIRLNSNPEAMGLLRQLSQLQAEIRKKQSNGGVTQEDIQMLRRVQQNVQNNRIIMDYARSQEEAVNFLRQINNEISQLLGVNFATLANRATC
ncbi:MAG: YlbF family regulator [Anaerolineales bacterium]